MKLVVTIVQDKDSNRLSNAFIESDIRATKLSSTGGFLRSGNTTFLIGIEDERVEEVLGIIKEVSKKRSEYVTPSVGPPCSFCRLSGFCIFNHETKDYGIAAPSD